MWDPAVFILLLASVWSICGGFNVDTLFPYVFTGPGSSYFGYTVALNRNSRGPVIIVGAPKANSTTIPETILESGALFQCSISRRPIAEESCEEVVLMKEGNTNTWNGNEFSYKDKKDNMWLGVSLDVRQSSTKNDVVVCGHLWRNQKYYQSYLANGVCYVVNADFEESSLKKLLPYIQRSRQTPNREYHYAYGQAGISAAYSEDASNLILGAPGFYDWTGSIVNYPIYRSRSMSFVYNEFDTPFPPNEINFAAYFGYSVSSGKFFDQRLIQYAVGAPRDEGHYGKVYIIRGGDQRISILDRKRGFQLGEYFGACVLGVDFNGDSFAALVVGAPLHSTEFGGDEGKVYVFISNGKDLTKQTEITGDKKPGARFGTAIANIGDINLDGYIDIAVGAPYEDNGAVYIYHGSVSGLRSRYVQKIEASAIDGRLSGFGIHVSRGLDVDDNGYPDILVGSYGSSQAVLFRSRPVINVHPRLSSNPKQIVMNVPCDGSRLNLTCVQINSCIHYEGEHVPPTLEFELNVVIQDPSHRGFFQHDMSRDVKSTTVLTVSLRSLGCYGFKMFLKKGIKDVITPVQVLFSHELKPPPGSSRSFDKSFPIYHSLTLMNMTMQVPFQTGCDKSDECHSNLKVIPRRTDIKKDTKFLVLRDVANVAIEVLIRNQGEPAYMSELYIYLPPGLSPISQDHRCDTTNQQHNASLVCELGNPLKNDSEVTIHIRLDISNLPPQTKYLGIDFEVVTISTEVDMNDNKETIPLFFRSVYDIGVTGTSSIDQIIYDGTEEFPIVVTHTYVIRNYGPSPLQTVYIDIDVPNEVITPNGVETLLLFTGETGQSSYDSVPVSCDFSSLNITFVEIASKQGSKTTDNVTINDVNVLADNSSAPVEQLVSLLKRSTDENYQNNNVTQKNEAPDNEANTPKATVIRINCDNKDIRCIKLRCTASSLDNILDYAQMSVSLQVNFTVLNKFKGQWYHIELTTNTVIRAESSDVMKTNIYPDAAEVKTDILHQGPPPPEKLESWIIFVSIGVGVLLLIILIIVLVKIGFFKRKEKDKMRRLVSESKRVKKKEDEVSIKDGDELEVVEEPNAE